MPPPGSWPTGCRFATRCQFAQQQCTEPFVGLPAHGEGSVRCIRVDELARTHATWDADDVGAEVAVVADPLAPPGPSTSSLSTTPTAGVSS